MDVLMPQLGETVAEGKISKWFKSAGDAVKPGDNLFEIETDKVSMEVPATSAGTLTEINFGVGETAKVGAVVAVIAGAGEAAKPASAASKALEAPKAAPRLPLAPAQAGVQPPKELGSRFRGHERHEWHQRHESLAYPNMSPWREVRTPERNYGPARLAGGATVTPLARRLAGENGIDLSRIKGSGPHGRIVAGDIESARSGGGATGMASGMTAAQVKALYADVPHNEVPLDGMRKTIAARLTLAKQTIPHFYLTADIAIDQLLKVRTDANAAAPRDKSGEPAFKLSVNDFVVKALALALQRVPAANAVWAQDRILRFRHSDIGVAVALESGLLSPVIRQAERKSLSALSREIKDLATRARDKKLAPAELQGGASAVSNLGMHGVREFSAIINPPHATILAVGASRRQPVEDADGGVRFASVMTATLSCDHRVVDGALGAELLAALRGFLENPVTMLV